MSFTTLNATPVATAPSTRPGMELAHELTALVDEIQRTRDWFNAQIEAQLTSLRKLRASMQAEEPICRASISTLFEAPHPVVAVETLAPAVVIAPATTPVFALGGLAPVHQAVVLPPAHITTLDPELEQATLRELNDALAKAFSEISSRGGMLG